MRKIRIAIVGVGNCASSLVQGINFYDGSSVNGTSIGLMHRQIGGYRPSDIEVVAAFDIDRRKVGLDVSRAIFSPPNCTKVFCEKIKLTGAIVKMGCVLDGYPPHMQDQDPLRTFLPSRKKPLAKKLSRAEKFLCGTDGQLSSRRVRAGHPILCRLRAGSRTRLCQ
jgi:Myo-inositol-1-phosphate synthase